MIIPKLGRPGALGPPAGLRAVVLATLVLALGISGGAAQQPDEATTALASPLAGGVPGHETPGPVTLTLRGAVQRGLEQNLAVVLGREQARAAAGARSLARSSLLPHLETSVATSRNVINLEAYGFPVAPGESPLIGPFNVFDARASVSATLVDLGSRSDLKAASRAADAAAATLDDVRDRVVLAVSSLYLQASAADSRILAARAQVATARALHDQAVDMKAAGVVAAIEVLRAEVQLSADRERLIVAENEAARSKLELARAIGLPLATDLVLDGPLRYAPPPEIDVSGAVRQALDRRADYRGARAAVAAAEAAETAARQAALPSLEMQAGWGVIGPAADSARTTYAVEALVRLPIYTGGAIAARTLVRTADLAERQARLADLEARIEYEVRSTLLDLAAADERVRVAEEAVGLANRQLEQSRDRFSAGVADGVEVVQAQQAAAAAEDTRIAALLAYNLAEVRLARALGVAAEDLDRFMGGRS